MFVGVFSLGGDSAFNSAFDCTLHEDVDVVVDERKALFTGVGLDIISSGSRASRFASRGESGDGELRKGEEDSGDGTCVANAWA